MSDLMQIFLLNISYAIIGVIIGIVFAVLTFKLFDKINPFNIPDELQAGNIAVGIVVGGMFVMIGLMVGLIIGMGLN